MRIGVICEGPTDFVAIEAFFGRALEAHGFDASFIAIQPDMDSTLPHGGWTLVESWLSQNPASLRVRRYFGGGLFADDLDSKQCDVFLVQIDSDILDDDAFKAYNSSLYGVDFFDVSDATVRRAKMVDVIGAWSAIDSCGQVDSARHVFAPSVENTEAWCVAAFSRTPNVETLNGIELTIAFMTALLKYENKTVPDNISKTDKTISRRRNFCNHHRNGYARLADCSPSFKIPLDELLDLAPKHPNI